MVLRVVGLKNSGSLHSPRPQWGVSPWGVWKPNPLQPPPREFQKPVLWFMKLWGMQRRVLVSLPMLPIIAMSPLSP